MLKVDNVELSLLRPIKQFKQYDIEKNFQIFLKEKERKFRPNHLRVLLDVNLRTRSRPDLKKNLLLAFDKIFNKEDPDIAIKELENEDFEHYLNNIRIIAYLEQLFLIEQDFNYHKESKFEPKTLFLHGWVRQAIDNIKEIDNLAMSVCSGQPPQMKYTFKNNKKHKKYDKDAKELWYYE